MLHDARSSPIREGSTIRLFPSFGALALPASYTLETVAQVVDKALQALAGASIVASGQVDNSRGSPFAGFGCSLGNFGAGDPGGRDLRFTS